MKLILALLIAGTYCGVFRRRALDKGGAQLKVDHLVTGRECSRLLGTWIFDYSRWADFRQRR